jgi:hypothetical protein
MIDTNTPNTNYDDTTTNTMGGAHRSDISPFQGYYEKQ